MNLRYQHLGLDEILGAFRMMHPQPESKGLLVELVGQHLLDGGWPGQIRRRYFDLSWHDGMASCSFLSLGGRSVNLSGQDEVSALQQMISQGDTTRWSSIISISSDPNFKVAEVKGQPMKDLANMIAHIDARMHLDANTPLCDQPTRPRARV